MSNEMKIVAILLIALLGFVGFKGYERWQVAQAAERAAAVRQRDAEDKVAIDKHFARWMETFQLASSTPRIALATPMTTMQALRNELDAMPVHSTCMTAAKARRLDGMKDINESFMAFMQQNETGNARLIESGTTKVQESHDLFAACLKG